MISARFAGSLPALLSELQLSSLQACVVAGNTKAKEHEDSHKLLRLSRPIHKPSKLIGHTSYETLLNCFHNHELQPCLAARRLPKAYATALISLSLDDVACLGCSAIRVTRMRLAISAGCRMAKCCHAAKRWRLACGERCLARSSTSKRVRAAEDLWGSSRARLSV